MFDGARVEYSDSEAESEEEEGSEAEEEFEGFDDDDDASEDEDDAKLAARPYMALIKSLTEDSDAPQAKRRKLDHKNQASEKRDEPRGGPDTTQDVAEDIDLVEEPEEAADEQDAQEAFDGDDDDDEKEDTSDPFESHFGAHDDASIARRLKAIEDAKWTNRKFATKGTRTVLSGPDTGDESDQIPVPAPVSDPSSLSLKHRLKKSLEAKKTKFDAVEQSLATYLLGYWDLLYCNRNLQNGKSVRRMACLHALNHVFKYASGARNLNRACG